ncbi:MAG: type II toxin-antitoxin system VapC family toxin [Thermodesulfobacteriota bacterium]
MRVLLDTHILLWCLAGEPPLPASILTVIQNATEVHASVASLWEIAIKHSIGKLVLDLPIEDLVAAIEKSGFEILSVKAEHAITVPTLPFLHRDPFDRMLIAQSMAEPLRLLTCDKALAPYGGTVLLCQGPRSTS